jgi:hypothetical protein
MSCFDRIQPNPFREVAMKDRISKERRAVERRRTRRRQLLSPVAVERRRLEDRRAVQRRKTLRRNEDTFTGKKKIWSNKKKRK